MMLIQIVIYETIQLHCLIFMAYEYTRTIKLLDGSKTWDMNIFISIVLIIKLKRFLLNLEIFLCEFL